MATILDHLASLLIGFMLGMFYVGARWERYIQEMRSYDVRAYEDEIRRLSSRWPAASRKGERHVDTEGE